MDALVTGELQVSLNLKSKYSPNFAPSPTPTPPKKKNPTEDTHLLLKYLFRPENDASHGAV